ncbi:MAG: M14 family zinc carboxypeptidase [Armatimonadaceae bacterium]
MLSRPALSLPPEPTPTGGEPYDFYSRLPYRSEVPRPSALLGYEAGERHTTFRDQERVILAIAAAARDRVRLVEYGKSVEGRPLRLIYVSHPDNLARLDVIRANNLKLADPRKLKNTAEADEIIRSAPTITWINHTIHGDESASFETAMWTLYTLAASEAPQIVDALKKSVIILNPVFNPDGHERFVVWYNAIAQGNPDPWAYEQRQPWAIRGRYNHYRFDMNRDKLAQSQSETRQETAAYLRWFPQVFVDQHGQPPVYFFPPNALPSNANVDRNRVGRWTDVFGRANGAVFDRYGWAYVTRETYDLFAPVYLDIFTTLTGAIGMTYETDAGGSLARRRDDGTAITLRDGVAHHLETALTTVVTAAQNRENLLRDFLSFRQKNLRDSAEKLKRVVILPDNDPNRAAELATLLTRLGIEVREAGAAFVSEKAHRYDAEAGAPVQRKEFPKGSLVVDLAQPQGHLARAYLEPDAKFEPDFVREQRERKERNDQRNSRERREGYEFYDITAWSLPMTFGLEAYWTEDGADVPGAILTAGEGGAVRIGAQKEGIVGGRADVAYLFRYDRDSAAVLALRLLQEGYRLQTVTRPVRTETGEMPRGTLIVRVDRNPDSVHQRISELAETLGIEVQAVNKTYVGTAGVGIASENNVAALQTPRIAVIADDVTTYVSSYGSVWYTLESAGVQFTTLRLDQVRMPDLLRYNVLIFPEGSNYAGKLGKAGIADLKDWLRRGGAVLGLGNGGTWFTDEEADLTTAKPVGEDDESRKPSRSTEDGEKPEPKTPEELPGAIFTARIDPSHFLGWGYPDGTLLVPLSGSTFLKPSTTGTNVVTFGKGSSVRSGFIWEGNTEELLAETAYVIDEPVGRGHALLYLADPTFRAYYPGLRRLFYSGILFGPIDSRPLTYDAP